MFVSADTLVDMVPGWGDVKVSRGTGHLEEDGDCRDTLGVGLVAVAQVTAVGKVEAHDAVVGVQQRCVHLEVGRRAGQRLHIHAPFLRVESKCCQCPLLFAIHTVLQRMCPM